MDVRVAVQAMPTDAAEWTATARRVEELGFDRLVVPDHPGVTVAPFVALAAAAATTDRIVLGTNVANAGVWEPLALALEVATLDVVSGGRAMLGIGAGHTPVEWTMRGVPHPPARQRVDRLGELVEVVPRLLAGETVTHLGPHVRLEEATLGPVAPVRGHVPLLVGGNGERVLRLAAAHADVVGLSGLGRTLADGHAHETRWATDEIDRSVEIVRTAADDAGTAPPLEALVQVVELTDDAEAAAHRIAADVDGLTAEQVLSSPYAWVGTPREIARELAGHHARWGVERYVIRDHEAAAEVLAEL
jgi:probable F420-dependent oxidoreductase